MSAVEQPLRIGELAALCDTTPRTIRYYEEIGLLEPRGAREAGQHRLYSQDDLERLRALLRLKDLLGLSLDELKRTAEAEVARAVLRAEYFEAETEPGRRVEILHEALGHIETQLGLVRRRREQLDALEQELVTRQRRAKKRLTELGNGA